ncbi:MAG: hypothetical protein N3A38_16845, partial [Planctomycetota bacterium]|nr:hypothetical protein [Planctomycetota bacterium]
MRSFAWAVPVAAFLSASSGITACGEEPAAAPASGAIEVGEETVLMPHGGAGGSRRGKPAVAFGRDMFLVAWQDGWHGDGGNSRIHALRVGLDGKPLDAGPVEVAPAKSGVQENPRLAFFGGVFLIVWQDMRNGRDCDVLGARVSSDGKVLDAEPIAIAAGPRTQAMPDVAADEKGFMVVWHSFPGDDFQAKVYARRVGADGVAGESGLVTVGSSPRIAWNGKEHLVVHFKAGGTGGPGVSSGMFGWERMDVSGKPMPTPRPRSSVYGDREFSVGSLPEGGGWVIVFHGAGPNYWARTSGVQQAIKIKPDGERDLPPDDGTYIPKGKAIPPNWLDTTIGKKVHSSPIGAANMPDIWPWGGSALARDGKYCVAVWQRFHLGDVTGMAMINGDIRASRVDGWKVVDGEGGVPAVSYTHL